MPTATQLRRLNQSISLKIQNKHNQIIVLKNKIEILEKELEHLNAELNRIDNMICDLPREKIRIARLNSIVDSCISENPEDSS